MKRDNKRRPAFTRRALLLGTAQLAIFGAIGAKLYKLQVSEHGKYALLAKQNSISDGARPDHRPFWHHPGRQPAALAGFVRAGAGTGPADRA
jgi:hypothetical protein